MGAIASWTFLLVVVVGVLSFFMLRASVQNDRRIREELYLTFESTMQQHGIRTFEILKESIWIGNLPARQKTGLRQDAESAAQGLGFLIQKSHWSPTFCSF